MRYFKYPVGKIILSSRLGAFSIASEELDAAVFIRFGLSIDSVCEFGLAARALNATAAVNKYLIEPLIKALRLRGSRNKPFRTGRTSARDYALFIWR